MAFFLCMYLFMFSKVSDWYSVLADTQVEVLESVLGRCCMFGLE